MKHLILLISSCCFLVSCVTASPSFVKDGKQIYEAKCNGLARSIADCHKKASEQCGGKYDVMSGDQTSSFLSNGNGGYMPVNNRSLLFSCK